MNTNQFRFQVPKGMLQTLIPKEVSWMNELGFKSPRECYKREVCHFIFLCGDWFQVPKGMLQTFTFVRIWGLRKSFKSPRECYKPNGTGGNMGWKQIRVSSPQGNATNRTSNPQITIPRIVSSPQGNATNTSPVPFIYQLSLSFKSPRECYKPSYYWWNNILCNQVVSSPQGNATNNLMSSPSYHEIY